MSATNEQLQESAEEQLASQLESGVVEYKTPARSVKRADPDKALDALLKLRGLTSSRRGLSLARRTDVR